jgi:DNA-binding winged helix-turn-helix (wHTH) protein
MADCIRFAEFELDLGAYVLRRQDVPLRLEKMPMEVLILLVQRAGTLVQRSEIQAMLWGPDVYVEHDSAINTALRKIRRRLGDDAENPRFVETVVGKGYRFIAPVESNVGPRAPLSASHGTSSALWRRIFPSYCVREANREFVLEVARDGVWTGPSRWRLRRPSVGVAPPCTHLDRLKGLSLRI